MKRMMKSKEKHFMIMLALISIVISHPVIAQKNKSRFNPIDTATIERVMGVLL